MPLSWNEIKSRALTFSRTWADATNEDSQGQPFWIDFFEIFGITSKRVATFEHAVKKLPGGLVGITPSVNSQSQTSAKIGCACTARKVPLQSSPHLG
jgi:hypothetical protein